ncbi:uncharacterized protein LY89DRAFT_777733 [Mollisia scopiformis]|uniref:Uncharacterized protein n=1 Tax=Mollisia scopiformis TaxID=149040 RepID=A0A194XR97_MOLSC|nr:uncharacterized protein LY89DRAFT_777733 [Mollisia scopiformis]KUJ22676.1 hypothetical protein LY89DRAFT_777733 [Mollisia scopiformis]
MAGHGHSFRKPPRKFRGPMLRLASTLVAETGTKLIRETGSEMRSMFVLAVVRILAVVLVGLVGVVVIAKCL